MKRPNSGTYYLYILYERARDSGGTYSNTEAKVVSGLVELLLAIIKSSDPLLLFSFSYWRFAEAIWDPALPLETCLFSVLSRVTAASENFQS